MTPEVFHTTARPVLTSRHLKNLAVPAQREPCSSGARADRPATALQRQLAVLSAPGPLMNWAGSYPDLESCWDACTSPECLLWLAARLSATSEDRRAVVSCLTEFIRYAGHGDRHEGAPVQEAVSAAEAWTRAEAGPGELLAAERGARETAERTAALAAEEAVRARLLFRTAPRARPASFGTSRALGVQAEWRAADHAWRLAAAAAWAARAAAQAGEADLPPESWAACVGESAGYAASSLARAPSSRPDGRRARKSARLIRRRLPRPRLDLPRSTERF